jgi:hypothetical protein
VLPKQRFSVSAAPVDTPHPAELLEPEKSPAISWGKTRRTGYQSKQRRLHSNAFNDELSGH